MKFDINGYSVAYEDIGQGPEVVFIHGFPLSRTMWGPQTGSLVASGYRVITFDLPGFGESDPMPIEKMSDYAEVLVKLLQHLKVRKAVIAGMSMGGYILFEFMARYPQYFEAALLIVTRAENDDLAAKAKRSELIQEVQGGNSEVVISAFEKILFGEKTNLNNPDLIHFVRGMMKQASSVGLVDGLNAMKNRMDRYHTLTGFAYPVWILTADEDKAIPVSYSRDMEQALNHCRLDIIKGAGHMVNMEKSKEFNHLLLDFLGEIFALQ